jgi:hypothetical protein
MSPLSLTQTIAQPATDALHEAIRVAWQAGYDCALMDAQNSEHHIADQMKEASAE